MVGHDGGVADDGGTDWAEYYAGSAGREPRQLLLAACEELGAGVLCASFAQADLPSALLIHAGFSLPFCAPQEFPARWTRIRQALAPGGVFAGQLFGLNDTWADDPDMTFHARHQVQVLLDGLDIIRLEETERDGRYGTMALAEGEG